MKNKNNTILGIAIIILIALIIFLLINNKNNSKESLEEITYNQVLKKVENEEDFIIVLSQTTCSHCADFKPILNKVAKENNIIIYYLDYDKYDKETQEEILEFFNFDGGTPNTFFFRNGKETSVMNRLTGSVSESKVIAALKKLEYIQNE